MQNHAKSLIFLKIDQIFLKIVSKNLQKNSQKSSTKKTSHYAPQPLLIHRSSFSSKRRKQEFMLKKLTQFTTHGYKLHINYIVDEKSLIFFNSINLCFYFLCFHVSLCELITIIIRMKRNSK